MLVAFYFIDVIFTCSGFLALAKGACSAARLLRHRNRATLVGRDVLQTVN